MSRNTIPEEALFAEALVRPVAERRAFLDQACGGDAALRARLDALLAAHEATESLSGVHLANPPADVSAEALAKAEGPAKAEESPGHIIGRYKLLEKLGEGGCGTVWAAEQREPVKRRVALKIIKLGMDTQQVIARFEAERQALALMDHPNIARMFDAGATATGRPYFVMELVRGIKITAYCDENNLTTKQRLELAIQVCHAIQHAHQKGIIHRDIKPSNVLVTLHDGVPVPKVIDFGIAKATQQELTEKTIYTRFQQFIGTPAYMSPEQAEMSGLDVDTRSDVYSLGVLIYELVTGRTPFDSRALYQQGVDEIRRTIRETEPPTPSKRLETLQDDELTTAARRRSTDSRKLTASVRGDLDWIVMKCLEKDRTRRYDTANGLAADIQRYLAHQPVVARPPSTRYLVCKFVKRHRFGFTATVVVAATLVLGLTFSTISLLRERAARARAISAERRSAALEVMAETARGQSEKLVTFLLDDFYAEVEPTGRLETVARLARESVAYYDGLPFELRSGATNRNRAVALLRWGEAIYRSAKFTEGAATIKVALAELEKLYGDGDRTESVVIGLAGAWRAFSRTQDKGDGTDIRAQISRSVSLLAPLARRADSSVYIRIQYADALRSLAASGKASTESIELLGEASDMLTEAGRVAPGDLSVLSAHAGVLVDLAGHSRRLGRATAATRLSSEAAEKAEKVLSAQPSNLYALRAMGKAHLDLSHSDALFSREGAWNRMFSASETFDKIARLNPSDAEAWSDVILARRTLSAWSRDEGRIDEALRHLRSAFDVAKDHQSSARILGGMADAARSIAQLEAWRGNRTAAFEMLNEAAQMRRTYHTERGSSTSLAAEIEQVDHEGYVRRVLFHVADYAAVCVEAEKAVRWIEALNRRPEISEQQASMLRRRLLWEAYGDLGRGHAMLERWAEAEAALRDAVAAGPGDTNYEWLAIALGKLGRYADAREAIAKSGLRQNRRRYAAGDFTLYTIWHLARAVLGEALAQEDDADGRQRRQALLTEARQALERLSAEARELTEIKELRRLIDREAATLS